MSLHSSTPLGKKIASQNAEDAARFGPASFSHSLHSNRSSLFLEFRPDARTRVGFSYAQLCQYTLEPNPHLQLSVAPERLTLAFSSADVMIYGARMEPIVKELVQQAIEWIAAVDERYANLSESPWVGRIDVQPYGSKPTTPSSPDSDAPEDHRTVRTSLKELDQGSPIPLPTDPARSAARTVR